MNSPQKTALLLISDDEIARAIESELSDAGFISIAAKTDNVFAIADLEFAPSVILIDSPQIERGHLPAITAAEALSPGISIPVLGLVESTPPIEIPRLDSILVAPYHAKQIVQRVFSLIRLSEMEREIGLRLETLKSDFGYAGGLPKQNGNERLSILFIGQAAPEFMVIVNALQKKNVSVVAAFTSFTAFDYLYEQDFDAVMINGLTSTEPAFTVASTMRKNAKLFHVPAILLVNTKNFIDHDAAYTSGVNDIIDADAPLLEISARLLEQANFHKMHQSLKRDFDLIGDEKCRDQSTGLYNKGFFDAHLRRINALYARLGKPVSICLIRVRFNKADISDANKDIGYAHIGQLFARLLRMQDLTARLDRNLFVAAFPGQSSEELNPVLERIRSILQCTQITDPINGAAIPMSLEITLNTLGDGIGQSFTAA